MVSPARRRDAVAYLMRRHPVSERRACLLVGQHRSTQRYERVAPEYEIKLVDRMNVLAAAHPRYGYRRVCALLRTAYWSRKGSEEDATFRDPSGGTSEPPMNPARFRDPRWGDRPGRSVSA